MSGQNGSFTKSGVLQGMRGGSCKNNKGTQELEKLTKVGKNESNGTIKLKAGNILSSLRLRTRRSGVEIKNPNSLQNPKLCPTLTKHAKRENKLISQQDDISNHGLWWRTSTSLTPLEPKDSHKITPRSVKQVRLGDTPTFDVEYDHLSSGIKCKTPKLENSELKTAEILKTPKARRIQSSLYDSPNFILKEAPFTTPTLLLKSRTPTLYDYVSDRKNSKFKVLDLTPSYNANTPASRRRYLLEHYFTKQSKSSNICNTKEEKDDIKKKYDTILKDDPLTKRMESVIEASLDNRTYQNKSEEEKSIKETLNTKVASKMYTGDTPSKIVGREFEKSVLNKIWNEHISIGVGVSVCITGCPGSGKTALLNFFLKEKINNNKIGVPLKVIKLNCVMISDAAKLFSIIHSQIMTRQCQNKVMEKTALKSMFVPLVISKKRKLPMHIVVLDEIDYIVHKNKNDIYLLFEWAAAKNSRLVLIGISNTLNFINKHIPLLNTLGIAPINISFKPYTIDEIKEIVAVRLKSDQSPSDQLNVHPMAVELIARKVAGTGDLRKALGICRHAMQLSSPSENGDKLQLSLESALAASKSACHHSKETLILSLTLQQKTVLLALYKNNKQAVSMLDLFAKYKFIFSKTTKDLSYTTRSEFSDMIAYLESRGLITLTAFKDTNKSQPSADISIDWLSTNVSLAFDLRSTTLSTNLELNIIENFT